MGWLCSRGVCVENVPSHQSLLAMQGMFWFHHVCSDMAWHIGEPTNSITDVSCRGELPDCLSNVVSECFIGSRTFLEMISTHIRKISFITNELQHGMVRFPLQSADCLKLSISGCGCSQSYLLTVITAIALLLSSVSCWAGLCGYTFWPETQTTHPNDSCG